MYLKFSDCYEEINKFGLMVVQFLTSYSLLLP